MGNKVKGSIRLNGQDITKQVVSCTGSQLASILEVLQGTMYECKWFAIDVSTNDGTLPEPGISKQSFWIENTKALIDFTKQIDQYLSGIFLAISKDIDQPDWERYFDTEDEPTEDLEDAVLEIRAFDTTYFEIYSSDLTVLQILFDHFKVPIILT